MRMRRGGWRLSEVTTYGLLALSNSLIAVFPLAINDASEREVEKEWCGMIKH